MENNKKLKILFPGKKGILIKRIPKSYLELISLIENSFKMQASDLLLTFTDSDSDECEILDEHTYQAACIELKDKVIIQLLPKSSPVSSRMSVPIISPSRVSLKYFKKKSRMMAVFDVESESIEWIGFPIGILFKEYAAWVELPEGEIFYCGGGHPVPSNEAYILNPYTQSYKILPNMADARHSHGVTYSNGAIYVMGGITNTFYMGNFIKDCEKYNIDEEKWEKLFDMETPRGDTSVIAINENIFLFGKGSNFLIEYNSNSFKLDLKEDQGGCMSFVDNLLYIFHGSKVKVCDIQSKKLIEEHKLPRKGSWWSHCPPIVYLDFIYFIWWEEPGWICRYNRLTKEFKKIISL